MAWHMGIHAHARTLSPGTIPQNGMTLDFGEFACVCRHGNMYILHGLLTVSVSLWLQAKPPLMFISTTTQPRRKSGENVLREYQVSTCLHSVQQANQDTTLLHEPLQIFHELHLWAQYKLKREADTHFLTSFRLHYSVVLVSYCGFWISQKPPINLKEKELELREWAKQVSWMMGGTRVDFLHHALALRGFLKEPPYLWQPLSPDGGNLEH